MITQAEKDQIVELYLEGYSANHLRAQFNHSTEVIQAVLREANIQLRDKSEAKQATLQLRAKLGLCQEDDIPYLPSVQEIEEATAKIREGWAHEDFISRTVGYHPERNHDSLIPHCKINPTGQYIPKARAR